MQTVFDEKEQLQSENQELTKQKAKLELTIKDIQDDLEGDAKAKVGREHILFWHFSQNFTTDNPK